MTALVFHQDVLQDLPVGSSKIKAYRDVGLIQQPVYLDVEGAGQKRKVGQVWEPKTNRVRVDGVDIHTQDLCQRLAVEASVA